MWTWADIALFVAGLPLGLATLYLLLLTALSGRLPPRPRGGEALRFAVAVPAHNEALVISRTLDSLKALQWPQAQYRICVVADNCTDDTAGVAAAAGATVYVRNDPVLRGKGHALNFLFKQLLAEGWADAVLVIDADSVATPNALAESAAVLAAGAPAAQLYYGVLNPEASRLTRLMVITHAIFHRLRSRARERLGVSCGFRGNGMLFSRSVLERIPFETATYSEDVEYGIRMALAGERVWYVDEAEALAEMVSRKRDAGGQRHRWERGRRQLAQHYVGPLLRDAWRRKSAIPLDLAADLLVPPLGYVGLGALAYMALALLHDWSIGYLTLPFWGGVLSCGVLLLHVLRGVALSGRGWRGVMDLLALPSYLAWKVWSLIRHARAKVTWDPVTRERRITRERRLAREQRITGERRVTRERRRPQK